MGYMLPVLLGLAVLAGLGGWPRSQHHNGLACVTEIGVLPDLGKLITFQSQSYKLITF